MTANQASAARSEAKQSEEAPRAAARARGPQDWETVVGLEVHAQLRTHTKLFSAAPNAFGQAPNTGTTEVDLGLPGSLPVLNERAVELALRVACALGCTVREVSRFERKHYFYPDLPKGYQISQYLEPYAEGGAVPIELDGEARAIPLTRIHMEEDAGKSIHDDAVTGPGVSHVDLNRAGVPLIEIVTEPALRSPEEAGAYLRSLRTILRCLEVSDADMEKGQFRCDANVSVRRTGETVLGAKVELKNMNSFRSVEHAIANEVERQIEQLEDGGRIFQETRHWDERTQSSRTSRRKEDADDYRYFPDPDLVPLRVTPARIAEITRALPELPHVRRARYREQYGLSAADAPVLADDTDVAQFFEATLAEIANPRLVATWMLRSVLELLASRGGRIEALGLSPARFAGLLRLVDAGRVTPASAREVLAQMIETGGDAEAIVRERGLEALSDAGELEQLVRAVIADHPDQVAKCRAGDAKLLNFLVGQVMRRTGGKASPAVVRERMEALIRER
jgi:aspartyl-tRNA(Asn)/glutamyl-tRNA(Gln) amidotransferase subunit B